LKILGIRTAPKQLRYALIKWDGTNAILLNTLSENLIKMPTTIDNLAMQLHWLEQEIARIIRQHPDICKIAIKPNEYRPGRESEDTRIAAYFDGIVHLKAAQSDLPIISKLYRKIGTKRADVAQFAEDKVGRTDTYWNQQMADAIAVAWSCIGN
jgi:Holliday junction resolvasome RuvABC endonuclease subunit